MGPLRRLLDRLPPLFEEGGKLHALYPLYEVIDTFLYSTAERTRGAPHVRDGMDLKRIMTTVFVALLPCVFMAMWNTGLQANIGMVDLGLDTAAGWRHAVMGAMGIGYDPESFGSNLVHGALYFLPSYAVTMIAGGLCEVLFALVRRHEINEGFLVTGLLFPLTLPAGMPLWQVALGIVFGVVIGKEIFGGTGRNFLNPALVARAFVYFAYPVEMSGDQVWVAVDGYTQATPLTAVGSTDAATGMGVVDLSWTDAFLGVQAGSMGETSTLACLIGAGLLVLTGIGSWRIMLAMLLGAVGTAGLFRLIGSDTNAMFQMPVHWHLVTGGLAFGLVFMATDPVSAAQTDMGRWIYGILIGVATILIRVVNPAYPEGVMLAILLGNVFAPLIDWFVVRANVRRRAVRYVS